MAIADVLLWGVDGRKGSIKMLSLTFAAAESLVEVG